MTTFDIQSKFKENLILKYKQDLQYNQECTDKEHMLHYTNLYKKNKSSKFFDDLLPEEIDDAIFHQDIANLDYDEIQNIEAEYTHRVKKWEAQLKCNDHGNRCMKPRRNYNKYSGRNLNDLLFYEKNKQINNPKHIKYFSINPKVEFYWEDDNDPNYIYFPHINKKIPYNSIFDDWI